MKVRWRTPTRSDVVVFDAEGHAAFGEMVLHDIPHTVLPSRREELNLSPRVIALWFAGLFRCHLADLLNPRRVLGELYRMHLLAWLGAMRPRVVITFIDNSYPFQWASRRLDGPVFVAVQNGVRLEHNVTDWLPPKPLPGSRISMPLLLSFGEFERDLHTRFGHDIDRVLPIGSVRASHFVEQFSLSALPIEYDVCLVSQWDRSIMLGGACPTVARGLTALHEAIASFLVARDLRLAVALRSDDPEESAHYRQLFGSTAAVIPSDRAASSTYRTMAASRVSVSFYSTACVEALGWGSRTLFVNLTDDSAFDFPVEGPWRLTTCEAAEFGIRINQLLELDDDGWAEASREAAMYVMAYDRNRPAHRVVRRLVKDVLGGTPE